MLRHLRTAEAEARENEQRYRKAEPRARARQPRRGDGPVNGFDHP